MAGGIYHVTSRGNERRAIFKDDADRHRFLERLAESAETHQVRVYQYCLMGNHVHVLLETPLGNLDRFMGSLLTGYTVYFNRRHQRAGHLMQGRYGAQVVEGTEYLLKLSRYIHLNPVHTRETKRLLLAERTQVLRRYAWSSYPEYTGSRTPCGWLDTAPVLALLEGGKPGAERTAYRCYVEAGLAGTDEEFVAIIRGRGVALGTPGFVEEVKRQYRGEAAEGIRREDVAFRHIRQVRSVEEVERTVAGLVGVVWSQRKLRKTGRLVRGVWAWALQQYAGLTQREAAVRLGLGTGAAISKMVRTTQGHEAVRRWREELKLLFKG